MIDRDEDLIDLDAFAPAPGKRLKFRGQVYAVRNMADIPADDVFLILRAEQELRGKTPLEQLEVGLRYVGILVPAMDRATLGGLSSNDVLRIMRNAMGLAEVPPMGGDGSSGSPISSPSSPGSTDGLGANSGA
jgi:hypothetical protein